MKQFYFLFFFIVNLLSVDVMATGVNGIISGIVKDVKTKETLYGAQVMIQGTTIGTITDFEGRFVIPEIKPGEYNLIISFLSYDRRVERITVSDGELVDLMVELSPLNMEITQVNVVEQRRTDTESSMTNLMKISNVVMSGISATQISKSLDKDAAEVVRRIPGITIIDDRFIVIRGLIERYNSVWLNNAVAPSSESDIRAFSFDLVPSSVLDNIMVYKTPAPDLPADFAGGVVKVFTKNTAYDSHLTVNYGTSFQQGTTFNDFYTYKGGKTDWLGFDDGSRQLPSNFPTITELQKLSNMAGKTPEQVTKDKATITQIGRSFDKNWNSEKSNATPNQSIGINLSNRFLIGKISVGTINSINYGHSLDYTNYKRAGYIAYNTLLNRPDTSYRFNDHRYSETDKIGVLSNWSFIFGNNQKVEFRNLFNQIGNSRTTLRDGRDFYGGSYTKAYELAYMSRSIYSGQLAGTFNFNNEHTKLDWILGYSYANKNQPDNRRVTYLQNDDATEEPYYMATYGSANPDFLGRMFMYNKEYIYSGGVNVQQNLNIGSLHSILKLGVYSEQRKRNFDARNIGFVEASGYFDWRLRYLSVDSLFMDENINDRTGLKIAEATNLSDSYTAENILFAAYAALQVPVTERIDIYAGFRAEKNKQTLSSYRPGSSNIPVQVDNDTLNIFPSANITYRITDNSLIRLAYGMTINRPEFREIAPYAFYNFEEKAAYFGNDTLKNAYIHNLDLRYEFYPNRFDMITFAVFYKKFSNPIEAILFPAGTGWNYQFKNVEEAMSMGAEIDIRKSLANFADADNILRYLRDVTLVFNAAYIKSEVTSKQINAREIHRPMQGQSPYIVNASLFYHNKSNFALNIMYNIIGKRIVYVGDRALPHIYEIPRNSIDILMSQKIGKFLTVKAGIKDLLDEAVVYKNFDTNTNSGGSDVDIIKFGQVTRSFSPGRLFTLGLSVSIAR